MNALEGLKRIISTPKQTTESAGTIVVYLKLCTPKQTTESAGTKVVYQKLCKTYSSAEHIAEDPRKIAMIDLRGLSINHAHNPGNEVPSAERLHRISVLFY